MFILIRYVQNILHIILNVSDKPEEALNLPPEDTNNSTCYSPVRMKKIKTFDY